MPAHNRSEACASLGLVAGPPDVPNSVTALPVKTRGSGRVAVCLTGQMRSFSLAFGQWHSSGLLHWLGDIGVVDWHLVSSSTPSFNGTLPLTKSLNVKSALLVTTLGFINNGSKGAHAWTETQASEGRHRSTIGAGPGWSTADLRINLAHRLWAEHGEFADDSQLQCPGCQEKVWEALHLRTMAIQHWQALKCQQLISREERALKQEYNAVVHLRPDVVVFWGHPDITSDHAERLGAVRTCSFVASHRLQRTSAGASRPWLLRPAMNVRPSQDSNLHQHFIFAYRTARSLLP